jgi:hypothetical protein
MFIFRKLFFMALVLVAVFLGASVVLESFAESQLATGVGRSLGLQARPAIRIDAFPILYRIMQGTIPKIEVVARDLTIQHLEIAELDIDMHRVHADIGVLIRSDRFDLLVEEGEGTARITEDAVNAYLVFQKVDVHVTFKPDGSVFVRADRVVAGRARRFEATGKLTLDVRKLIFKPARVTVDGKTSTSAALAGLKEDLNVRSARRAGAQRDGVLRSAPEAPGQHHPKRGPRHQGASRSGRHAQELRAPSRQRGGLSRFDGTAVPGRRWFCIM